MKTGVINFTECTPGAITASNKIAKYISSQLSADLIDSKKSIRSLSYDRLWVVNGIPVYSPIIEELKYIIGKCPEVIWVGNDYLCDIWSPVRKKKNLLVVSNYEKSQKSKIAAPWILFNWNQLAYTPIFAEPYRRKGLSYYGAYRENREIYFKKYFSSDLYSVWLNPSKDEQRFKSIAPNACFWSCDDLISALSSFQSTLYIEDTITHTRYNHPANRFYEALSSGTLVLFDKSCEYTFRRAQIDISDFVVDGPEDYAKKLLDSEDLLYKQRKKLCLDYRGKMDEEFAALCQKVESFFDSRKAVGPKTVLRKSDLAL